MTAAYEYETHVYDVVVVGAGGAGLRATLGMAEQGLRTACVTKVFPTRSHTVAAQGGIAASLSNMGPDHWQWHMYDTVKGSDWLGDTDAMEYLARSAPAAVYELEHYGVPFSRTEEGKIYQRPFGGHTTEFGEGPPVQRTCAAADRTGHAILHTLYGQSVKNNAEFYIEYFAIDLIMSEDGQCQGVVCWKLDDGTMHVFNAKMVVLATGGYGRAYFSATSAHTCTGDGGGMVARAGLPLQDMEFVQFHPTAMACGIDPAPLATEALRGEGAVLVNRDGNRFMLDAHPDAELAPRDIVARAVYAQTQAGLAPALDTRTALGAKILTDFPAVAAACQQAGLDPVTQVIPVAAAAHYHMGGVATDADGASTLPGLWACGEVASTGLHGANRLASNGLLEALVYLSLIHI